MKKTLAAALAVLLLLPLLAACGKRTDAVKQVEAMIDSIGTVTPESGALLSEIRAAYDALSEQEKAGVKKKKRTLLETKEGEYASLTEILAYLKNLNAAAGTGVYTKGSPLSELLGQAGAMKEKFNALPEDVRSQIEGFDQVDQLLSSVQTYVDAAFNGAVEYVKAFYQLRAGKNDTVSGVYCIKYTDPVEKKEKHIYALTFTDAAGEEHAVYMHGRVGEGVTAKTLLAQAETCFAENPPAGNNDPVANGNVTLDTAAVLAAAGK